MAVEVEIFDPPEAAVYIPSNGYVIVVVCVEFRDVGDTVPPFALKVIVRVAVEVEPVLVPLVGIVPNVVVVVTVLCAQHAVKVTFPLGVKEPAAYDVVPFHHLLNVCVVLVVTVLVVDVGDMVPPLPL